MSCLVKRTPEGAVESMTFACDAEGCASAPTDDEIIAAGGMKNMGWHCSGGRHFCPHHHPSPEESKNV